MAPSLTAPMSDWFLVWVCVSRCTVFSISNTARRSGAQPPRRPDSQQQGEETFIGTAQNCIIRAPHIAIEMDRGNLLLMNPIFPCASASTHPGKPWHIFRLTFYRLKFIVAITYVHPRIRLNTTVIEVREALTVHVQRAEGEGRSTHRVCMDHTSLR